MKRIAVVGRGIIGLTSALALLRTTRYHVHVFSRDPVERTASGAAGAYWWPHQIYPEQRVQAWARETYFAYRSEAALAASGVRFHEHFRFCMRSEETSYARALVDEWEEIDGRKHGIAAIESHRLVVPMIDVPIYLEYLEAALADAEGTTSVAHVDSPDSLFPDFDLVVNCTGLGAREFVNDASVVPIRGQSVRIALPKGGLSASTRIVNRRDTLTLVLPRSRDCILGGTAGYGDASLEPRPSETEEIRGRCERAVPAIAGCRVLGVTVGLRPGRPAVRLELESAQTPHPVIHNYGHGGGGYTVAWGCAKDVVAIADRCFS